MQEDGNVPQHDVTWTENGFIEWTRPEPPSLREEAAMSTPSFNPFDFDDYNDSDPWEPDYGQDELLEDPEFPDVSDVDAERAYYADADRLTEEGE